ncbi:hypothetical protein O3S80_53000, partial [Streptomyces sp. Lzd4kr]|nr:hypothetical protein [Streptomyces sp. Lzd4kr]
MARWAACCADQIRTSSRDNDGKKIFHVKTETACALSSRPNVSQGRWPDRLPRAPVSDANHMT